MKLSRRRKNAKRVKYTRRTKYHCKKYKNKQTYRKHSHKIKKNKRVMRGGDGETGETGQPVQQPKPYEFTLDKNFLVYTSSGELDENLSMYKSSGDLTYKRENSSFFTGTKTKHFDMTLQKDNGATMQEEIKKIFIQLSTTRGNNTSYDGELNNLTRSNYIKSIRVYRQVFAVFKLEMTGSDEKQTKFVVYFKVDIANAYDANSNAYLKAFVTYSPDAKFDNLGTVIETPFMKVVDDTLALPNICSLFKTAGLAIPDQGTNDKRDTCYFSCKDNSDFFWKLTHTMVKFATDIEFTKIKYAREQYVVMVE